MLFQKIKKRLVEEYFEGHHQNDKDLEEDYLDWFFLSKFGKGPAFWKSLSVDKIVSITTFQNKYEEKNWETWVKILSKVMGG